MIAMFFVIQLKNYQINLWDCDWFPTIFLGYNNTGYVSTMVSPGNDMVEVGPGPLKMSFSAESGQLKRIFNPVSGVSLKINLSYLSW